jgi:virginiamycin A acetyltransferase
VIIGNDVWIGKDVTILGGVNIGDGACIGTKALVTKNVAPYSIVGGVPAKEIKKRYSAEKIEFLLSMKWWDWGDERIRANREFFMANVNSLRLDEMKRMVI